MSASLTFGRRSDFLPLIYCPSRLTSLGSYRSCTRWRHPGGVNELMYWLGPLFIISLCQQQSQLLLAFSALRPFASPANPSHLVSADEQLPLSGLIGSKHSFVIRWVAHELREKSANTSIILSDINDMSTSLGS